VTWVLEHPFRQRMNPARRSRKTGVRPCDELSFVDTSCGQKSFSQVVFPGGVSVFRTSLLMSRARLLFEQARKVRGSCFHSPTPRFLFTKCCSLLRGVRLQAKKQCCRLLIEAFISTVFISEFLAAVSRASVSLICPASGWCLLDVCPCVTSFTQWPTKH
jgi:hypothetical protein